MTRHPVASLEALCWCRECGAAVLRRNAQGERCPACAQGTDTRSECELRATYRALVVAAGCAMSDRMRERIADEIAHLEACGMGDDQ